MADLPTDRHYAATHEWAVTEGDLVVVGVTQYAVDQLTDVTHLQLPRPGAGLQSGRAFGEIESVKAVFDLNSPVSGEVVEVNAPLATDPSPINADCYGAGWMIKVRLGPGQGLDHLMGHAAYAEQLAGEAH